MPTEQLRRGFASDNNAGVHPAVLESLARANVGHCVGYGDDPFTQEALGKMREVFGPDSRSFFVFTGTAANVLCIKSVCRSHHSVLCPHTAHLNVDECGAPENYTGCKLVQVDSPDGKLRPGQLEPLLEVRGVEHHSQPRLVSITQPTELGTVYTTNEINALADFAHRSGLYLHMDGARLANAAVSLDTGLYDVSGGAGADLLSFGGTKNGLMFGEAVVIFTPDVSDAFKYMRKQAMQLGSKMRFLSAQFAAYLAGGLWRTNAEQANRMALRLAGKISSIQGCKIVQEVQSNAVFVQMPLEAADKLAESFFFYFWDRSDSARPVIRLMCSFDTSDEDVDGLVDALGRIMQGKGPS